MYRSLVSRILRCWYIAKRAFLPNSQVYSQTSPAMNTLTTVCALIALVGKASAWGNLGHETVGYVAQSFLAPNALSFVQSSLGSTYSQSLGVAATVRRLISSTCLTRLKHCCAQWADTVKYETAYEWSAPLHFVDANGQCMIFIYIVHTHRKGR